MSSDKVDWLFIVLTIMFICALGFYLKKEYDKKEIAIEKIRELNRETEKEIRQRELIIEFIKGENVQIERCNNILRGLR